MALSYVVIQKDQTYGYTNSYDTYEDALAKATKEAKKSRKTFVIFQSSSVVGQPEVPVEIIPTYFDYTVNVKKANVVDTMPAPVCDYDDEDED